ncbi:MAG: hypothetical protein JEZ12_23365 [Desulfobacterium sp.]|nr:hypothetical protein [Desulfobacterium sp.]
MTKEGGGDEELVWTYTINQGQKFEVNQNGFSLNFQFSDLQISVGSRAQVRKAYFSGTVSGDARGRFSVNVAERLVPSAGSSLVDNSSFDMELSLSAYGESIDMTLDLNVYFSPAVEWFIDRSDLDTLPIGYVFNGDVSADVKGSVSISGYGSQRLDLPYAHSSERWEIIEKLDSITVQGKTYENVVKVKRNTLVPDLAATGSNEMEVVYWVAKGVGMIKGIGQYQYGGMPLTIELKDTNLEIAAHDPGAGTSNSLYSQQMMVTPQTPEEIANAPVKIQGSGSTPGSEQLRCIFPSYPSPVDIFLLYVAPDGSQYYPNTNGRLICDGSFGVYRSNVVDPQASTFDCSNLSKIDGEWQVYWLIHPVGGNWQAYEFGGYRMGVTF